MKKNLLTLLLRAVGATTALAQANPGCDGVRYTDSVFAATTKTTVVYANTVNVLGVAMNAQAALMSNGDVFFQF